MDKKEKTNEISLWERHRNMLLRSSLAVLTVAIVLYLGAALRSNRVRDVLKQERNVDPFLRVDCAPKPGASEDDCRRQGCLWGPIDGMSDRNIPYCHFPQDTGYEHIKNQTNGSIQKFELKKSKASPKNPYGGDYDSLRVESEQIGKGLRVKIGAENAYEPDVYLQKHASIESTDRFIFNTSSNDVFTFTVTRESTGERIWDTSIGGLIFGPKYIQLATLIPTDKIYGFGEHIHQTLQHDLKKYHTWPMFARDQPPNSYNENYMNLYGVHNFYMGVEEDGKAHGVFVLNSHAQEVTTGPGPHLVYRAIGGQFEIFFFPGPKPEDVIRQYQQVIGTPYLPAYWALGFQLCRYGFLSLQDMKDTVQRVRDAKIPIDTVIPDIDYMERYKDFTVGQDRWSGLPDYAEELASIGMHLTVILDPAIQVDYSIFENAKRQNVSFLSWPRPDLVQHSTNNLYSQTRDTTDMLAVVWPDRHVAFPDFYDDTNITGNWWKEEIKTLHKRVVFDGLWIDMNEPSAFSTNDEHPWYYDNPDHPNDEPLWCPRSGPDGEYDEPPYTTFATYQFGYGAPLCQNTLCMLATTNRGKDILYNNKNLYGLKETIDTYNGLKESTGKRGQVISRSTFPSSGRYAGHWLGDNTARWEDLRTTVIGVQEFNLFGLPFVGSDVCGFVAPTNEELCLRWQQLGAFHSFYRNHNAINNPPQDPAQWPSVAEATRKANHFRYRHLPYLYSLHFAASQRGGTVIRPVYFEFPQDSETYELSYQFMWGPAIMAAPVIFANVDEVRAYIPYDSTWYALYGKKYGQTVEKGFNYYEAPINTSAPVFIRGGYVILRQVPAMTTRDSRKGNMQLLLTLNENVLNNGEEGPNAQGEFYWDQGDNEYYQDGWIRQYDHQHYTFNFTVNEHEATLNIVLDSQYQQFVELPKFDEIEVFGYPKNVNFNSVKINGKAVTVSKQQSGYSPFTKLLHLNAPNGLFSLNKGENQWKITWSNV
ncbi:unnamed protein product [Bursaphelenchus okinawaensis]|uniref:Maltase n=1 Tax=Bursaphelenchus okinawaensis TaxID=465554 RepID=A0A811KZ54_9BILA|nr:unnamed protein product [Bursaphelenchus okinawaensis]CAG9114935.1 unnamed protein product [Bursaphelenchus okinawaensis]